MIRIQPGRTIKVLCVDDNYLVAEGIRIKLQLEEGFEWVGQLPDAERLQNAVAEMRPDVVLLDLDMPGKDAFSALREVTSHHPETRVIIISGHVRGELLDKAIDAGAWGYISKGDGADAIVDAVRQVMDGEFIIGNTIAAEQQLRSS